MSRPSPVLWLALAPALIAPAAARAGGLLVPGVGPQAAGRAGAFVARADDASALAYNPAGLAGQVGTVILVGANFIDYDVSFQRDGAYEPEDVPWSGDPYPEVSDASSPALGLGGFQAVPMVAVSTDLGLQVAGLRFGFGLVAPLAYPSRDFDTGYEFEEEGVAPPPQRYDVVSQEAAIALPSIAVSYGLGKALGIGDTLDVGARFSWGVGSIKATTYVWGFINFDEAVSSDSVFSVDVSDRFIPVFATGALYRPTDNLEVGMSYTSQIDVRAKGTGTAQLGSSLTDLGASIEPVDDVDAACDTGGTAESLKACVNFGLPMTGTLGVRWVKRERVGTARVDRADAELDVVWENWSATPDYEVIVDGRTILGALNTTYIRHGLRDTVSIRAGGSYVIDAGSGALALRAGAAYDTAAAREGWERVDLDGAARTTMMAGASWRTTRFQIDVAGGVVLEGTRDVGDGCNPSLLDRGCGGTGADQPQADRTAPDPAQPLAGPLNQVQSPFNAGRYESGYVTFALGVSTWF